MFARHPQQAFQVNRRQRGGEFLLSAKRECTMTEDHESLQERLLARSMGVLLTIQGTGAGVRAKSDHISSHLPFQEASHPTPCHQGVALLSGDISRPIA
jgi:hypothetical protein